MGWAGQHPSPNVKTICNFEPQIWPEILTSRALSKLWPEKITSRDGCLLLKRGSVCHFCISLVLQYLGVPEHPEAEKYHCHAPFCMPQKVAETWT